MGPRQVSVGRGAGEGRSPLDEQRGYRRSELFLVRLWVQSAQTGSEATGCRGRVQRVVDGETRQFDDWPTLIASLTELAYERYQAYERLTGGQDDE